MDELSPEAARLLALARREHEPSRSDSERVRTGLYSSLARGTARLDAALAAPASLAPSQPMEGSLGGATTSAGGLSAVAAKATLIAAFVGSVTLSAWLALPNSQQQTAAVTASGAGQQAGASASPLGSHAEPRASTEFAPAAPELVGAPGDVVGTALRGEPLENTALRSEPAPTAASDSGRAGDPQAISATRKLREAPRAARLARPKARVEARGLARERRFDAPARRPSSASLARGTAHSDLRSPAESPASTTGTATSADTAPTLNAAAQPAEPAVAPAPATSGELALVRAAITSLNRGDVESALELLDSHAVRFPDGVMEPERSGLRALALCTKGDLTTGRREQQRLLGLEAGSSLVRRVRKACAEKTP